MGNKLHRQIILLLGLIAVLLLSSCGGGGGDGGSSEPPSPPPPTPTTILNGKLLFKSGVNKYPVIGAGYSAPRKTKTAQKEKDNTALETDNTGKFTYVEGDNITFYIGGKSYSIKAKSEILISELAAGNSELLSNLRKLLLNSDENQTLTDGIDIQVGTLDADPALDEKQFEKQLFKALGKAPILGFSPSLGINLESAQAESDTAGQAMPFVDIFRMARPFKELSPSGTTFDANGWPTSVPAGEKARTKLLQGNKQGMLPSGEYTLLYEGEGKLEIGGSVATPKGSIAGLPNGVRGVKLDLNFSNSDDPEANALGILISDISEGHYIKNIRIIMPGGTCKYPDNTYYYFSRMDTAADCPSNTTYESFKDRLLADRNAIIFNPEYLAFLRNFRVIRMMNFMDASPGISNCRVGELIDDNCILQAYSWDQRATLDDAVWGGSSRTPFTERKGVPVEVLVELANQLKRDPWFNIPHFADDIYITNFANYVAGHLDNSLKVYIEYSNEIWNSGFIAFHYMEKMGIQAGLNVKPASFSNDNSRDEAYFARINYYSKAAVEVFELWKTAFGGNTDSLIRVLGTSQGDTVLSQQILEYENAAANGKVDALAMAPYFFGCIEKTGSCANAPKVLSDLSSVDDVFDVIDQPFDLDPSGMAGTIEKISRQALIARSHNVQLLAYEGGQHLTIMGAMGSFDDAKKQQYREFFKAANRDARMKERYTTLLNAWKDQAGTGLFNLYTLPQTYYEYGNWGLKEHLGMTRSESPKFDAAMEFQETIETCWWNESDCK